MNIKKRQFFLFLLIFIYSFNVRAFFKVIYGDDNRVDPQNIVNPMYLSLAESTAGMVKSYNLSFDLDSGTYKVRGRKLSQTGVCESERFADQITPANCSGFLVGKDILVTAGHCMRTGYDCSASKWVFDLNQSNYSVVENVLTVKKEDVYGCSEIIKSTLDYVSKNDFAIIRLDREVSSRVHLRFREEGKIRNFESLVVIGHPSGLPTKIADDGRVRKNDNEYFFETTLDTFGGNSGSPVFNSFSGVVEGILVRGERDYIYDPDKRCKVVKQCAENLCRGEDVTRITNLAKFIKEALKDGVDQGEFLEEVIEKNEIGLLIYDNKTTSFSLRGFSIEKISEISIDLNISHTYSGDLSIDLITPTGEKINLRNRIGGAKNNVIESYSSSDNELLYALSGTSALGIWKIEVTDHVFADRGKINSAKISVKGKKN